MKVVNQSILDFFAMNSQKELLEFMNDNPADKNVIILKELFTQLKKEADSND